VLRSSAENSPLDEVGLGDSSLLQRLGDEVNRLWELFNNGLHRDRPSRKDVEATFRDLVLWLTKAIQISPPYARKIYLAYTEDMRDLARKVIEAGPL